jgi:cellobiose epimerase
MIKTYAHLKKITLIGLMFLLVGNINAQTFEYYLTEKILKAWYPLAKDSDFGGYRSDFSYNWTSNGQHNKLIVSQARHLWVTSRAALLFPEEPMYKELATHGFHFMRDKMWDQQYGGFFYHMNRAGNSHLDSRKRIYGEAFAIYGLSMYYLLTGEEEALDLAIKTFHWIEEHGLDKVHNSYFQYTSRNGTPILTDDKEHNNVMHLLEAYSALYDVWPNKQLYDAIHNIIYLLDERLRSPEGFLYTYFNRDLTPSSNNFNEVSFGHNVQVGYLVHDAFQLMDEEIPAKTKAFIKEIIDHTLTYGWDQTRGGIYNLGRFNNPGYSITNSEKNWWTTAESLNSLLLIKNLYPEEAKYQEMFDKQWEYVLTYAMDTVRGGWYTTGLDTRASAITSNKGHIWKTSYHTGRALFNAYMDESPDLIAPANIAEAGIYRAGDKLLVKWNASWDDRMLTGYDLYIEGNRVAFTKDTFLLSGDFRFTGDTIIEVRARDFFHNRSEATIAMIEGSIPVNTQFDAPEPVLAVYPNPFKDFITIDAANTSGYLTIELFTMEGRKVFQSNESILHSVNLDVANFRNGFYILRILDSDGRMILNRKIIKQ